MQAHIQPHKHAQKHTHKWENESLKIENAEVLTHIKLLYMCLLSRPRVDYLPNPTER